jgi:hypothetical protein
MHDICKPFQVNFMCYLSKNLQNTSHFVTLFLAHGDIVVAYCFIPKKKRKKKEKKGPPPWYVKVGGHPMESVSHGL